MKIAKVLFKIAHELDKSGRPDLADAADSLAVKLANSPSQYTSVTDIDLTKIKTKHKVLKSLFTILNGIKIPFPSLQYSNKQLKAYGLYF